VQPTATAPKPTPTPETAVVPSLVGSTVAQAKTAAQVGAFELVTQDAFSNVVELGVIIDQDPKPGTRLEKGKQITVTVSQGPEFVTLPNVQGQTAAQAKGALEAKGLAVKIAEEPSKSVAEGRVIRSDPAQQASAGSTVTLYVSVGDKVQVPNVYRMPREQAAFELQNAGLNVTAVTPQSCAFIRQSAPTFDCANFPDGGVVSGTLQWESWVPRGSSIQIGFYDAKAR
jgi:serine/threonine-protein kinase